MARNTRSKRGEAATEMQEDPEAILRSERQRVRAARRQTTQVEAAEQGLSGPQAAAQEQEETVRQTAESDAQVGNASENYEPEDGTSAPPAGDTNRPGESIARQISATSGQVNMSFDGDEQDGASSEHQDNNGSASATDPRKETSAAEVTTSPTQQQENVGETAETNNHAHKDNEQAKGERHDLGDKKDEESEPKRPQHESEGAGPAGNLDGQGQPPSNPCQDFRDALRTFEELLHPATGLDASCRFQHGRHLPGETLDQAIASVTEAVSRRGTVLFSLLDHQSLAARPGRDFAWVQHRRDIRPGDRPGGHFSLFTVQWNEQEHRYHVEHRDSFPPLRNGDSAERAWTDARAALAEGHVRWTRGAEVALPADFVVPANQYDQTHSWTCGLCTIFNAWIFALGLPRTRSQPQMGNDFTTEACRLVRCAMRGCVDSKTIRDFLDCYGFIEAGAQVDADRTFDLTSAFASPDALAQRIAEVRLGEELERDHRGMVNLTLDGLLTPIRAIDGETDLTAYDSIEALSRAHDFSVNALQSRAGTNGDPNGGAIAQDDDEDDEAYATRVQNEEFQRTPPPEGQAARQGSFGADTRQQQPHLPRQADERDGEAGSERQQQSNADSQGNQSAPRTGNRPPQQTDEPEQRDAVDQGEANDGQRHEGENASAPTGVENDANRNERENAPSPDEEMRRSQRTAGQPSQEEQGEDAAARRQRALERLRPADDPCRPGRPLRPATANVQRGLDQGESELSMIIAPYSDAPYHQTLRNRYGLPNLTDVFHRTEQDEPPVQQQGSQADPAPSAAAAAGQVPQQDQQPPASDALQQPPAADALQQPPESGSDPVQDEQNNNGSNSDPPPAGWTSAPAAQPPPPAPAAGEPRIPGLQSTIPPPSTESGPTSAPTTNAAGGTNGSGDQPPGRRAASQESLPDHEDYVEQQRQEQLEREREELQRRGREFEQETQQGRQRAREERGEEGNGEGQGEDGDDGFGSLFGEAGSSETEMGE